MQKKYSIYDIIQVFDRYPWARITSDLKSDSGFGVPDLENGRTHLHTQY